MRSVVVERASQVKPGDTRFANSMNLSDGPSGCVVMSRGLQLSVSHG